MFGQRPVRSKSKFNIKGLPQSVTIIFATSLVVAIVLTFVWKNLTCVDYGYKIARQENQLQQALKMHNELSVEYGNTVLGGADRPYRQKRPGHGVRPGLWNRAVD